MIAFLFALLFAASTSGSAGPAAAREFELRYSSASTLQVTFLERYLENGKLVRADAGVAYFRRPGRMRWEYQSPEKNLFLVDGKWAWFYVPADHTVTRVPAKQSSDWRTPIALLADHPRFSRICSAIAPSATISPGNSGNSVLFCLMRGAKAVDSPANAAASAAAQPLETRAALRGDAVFFEIDPRTGMLERVLVTRPGGISLDFRFANWEFNPQLPESLFHFSVPLNTAIVNGELPQHESSVNP